MDSKSEEKIIMKNQMNEIKKIWPILIVIKYIFSICITFLAYRTTQNALYIVIGLLELSAIIIVSNYLLGLNKVFGQIVHFILFLLFNIQMLSLNFAGSFITPVMIENIGFLHDLHGKFGEYLRLIIPMLVCVLVPVKRVSLKRAISTISMIVVIILEILILAYGGKYSPIGNVYELYITQQDFKKMRMLTSEGSADLMDFYNEKIDDYIDKPDELTKEPNVVLIFVEGLSENIIVDKRNIMPNLNKFKSETLSFDNYYNHTFATLKGLMGQLYSGYQLENLDDNVLISMQSILKKKGYQTAFINTEPTNVDFTNFLTSMRFDELVTDMDKVDHDAAYIHDSDAFDLLYDTMKKQNESGHPFFTAIYTFGTHVSLNSPDEKYGDGSDALLNRFYNLDYQIEGFLQKFKESEFFDNTILVITTDHATYADEDFVSSFPEYIRKHTELDIIPLYIYHKYIQPNVIDVNGRNSLSLVPTILDYMDISEENYFLGQSLFAPQSKELSCDTVFYDSYSALSTNDSRIESLPEDRYIEFADLLVKYFSVKGNADNVEKVNIDYVNAIVSDDCTDMTITMLNESDQQYENIWFAVWSDIDNQDDLQWYKATQKGSGEWFYSVDLSRHNSRGSYSIHVYEGGEEPQKYIGATSAYVAEYPPVDYTKEFSDENAETKLDGE